MLQYINTILVLLYTMDFCFRRHSKLHLHKNPVQDENIKSILQDSLPYSTNPVLQYTYLCLMIIFTVSTQQYYALHV